MGRIVSPENRIGILGGTFDPVHLGHLILAEEAHYQLKLDSILFLLTPFPPHKTDQEITHLEHRLSMLNLAVADNPFFQISRVDIDRPPPHFAVDSLKIIRSEYPQARLYYLMGGDSLRDLPHWYQPEQFIRSCDGIGVMCRRVEGDSFEEVNHLLPGIKDKVIFLTAPQFDISSRDIRRRISNGLPFRYFLPHPVYSYIVEQGLYR